MPRLRLARSRTTIRPDNTFTRHLDRNSLAFVIVNFRPPTPNSREVLPTEGKHDWELEEDTLKVTEGTPCVDVCG